jgi:serine/threonine protein kinase
MIADFGLATRVNEKVYLYCRCGTPGYVAPEVINIKDMKSTYSSVCDIYSAGLVFHLLLTGKAAFSGKSYNTVVKMNREAKVEFKGKAFDIVPASGTKSETL